ncbi:MAG: ecfA2 2 [Firmicutes bacterium]|nr:ecfA2 2 [Bacillota bacterium]
MSIVFKDVSYVYMPGTPFKQTALKKINFEIKKGEFVGIIGHTGSGKSTLVQHMNGLLKPSLGVVSVEDIDINGKGDAARVAKRKVGMVFQYPEHQLFEETVYDDIAFGPRNIGLDAEEIERRVRKALDFVGLDFNMFSGRSPFQLSGGQMRRIAIAGVVALEPEYLILDEPSAGLDPRGRETILDEIFKLHNSTGVTVILVSHNMEEVARFVDRLIVMHSGEISLDGEPRDIFRHSRDKLVQAGVDVPSVCTLLAELRGRGLPVEDIALTPEEATATIMAAMRRRDRC